MVSSLQGGIRCMHSPDHFACTIQITQIWTLSVWKFALYRLQIHSGYTLYAKIQFLKRMEGIFLLIQLMVCVQLFIFTSKMIQNPQPCGFSNGHLPPVPQALVRPQKRLDVSSRRAETCLSQFSYSALPQTQNTSYSGRFTTIRTKNTF